MKNRFLAICHVLFATLTTFALAAPALAANVGGRPESRVPAFPGAEGAGAITPGGRGGRVFEVTTLNDGGPGSLRAAIEAAGPRTVVFRISGIITLTNRLAINQPFITIAGQTAPGDGICVRGETTEVNTHDVIIRYMRFRRGNLDRRDDALGGNPVGRVMIDHCSCSWGLDENLSMYRHMGKTLIGEDLKLPAERITIQWCISSEALDLNNHAFGGTWGGRYSSFHHNLFACNTGRNPSIGWGDHIDYRNNVIFNWRHRTMDGGDDSSSVNVVNNYYKPGPAANAGDVRHRICLPQHADMLSEAPVPGRWYVEGNFVEGFPAVAADNWNGGVQFEGNGQRRTFENTKANSELKAFIERKRSFTPIPAVPIRTQTARDAFESVLAHAGATLPKRDSVDARIIESVRTGKTTVGKNGIVRTPDDAGGWPEYKSAPVPADTDHDGAPDEWEKQHGLNPNDSADGAKDLDGDGYTNLEEHLNGTDPTQFVDYTNPVGTSRTLAEPRAGEPAKSIKSDEATAAQILVAYHSLTGNTEQMAAGVAEGVKRVPGVVVRVKKVDEVSKQDLETADAIVLGGPTYYGNIPGKMKVVLDDWSWKMNVNFTDKVGGAFATGGGQVGGKEHVVISLLIFMLNNRMVVAGPLYQNDKTGSIWGEVGSAAMTGPLDQGVGQGELDSAHRLGERVAQLAKRIKRQPAARPDSAEQR